MARRLFHAIVLVGTAVGCASRDAPTPVDGGSQATSDSETVDSFVMPEEAGVDTGKGADSSAIDSAPPPDTAMPDVTPADGG